MTAYPTPTPASDTVELRDRLYREVDAYEARIARLCHAVAELRAASAGLKADAWHEGYVAGVDACIRVERQRERPEHERDYTDTPNPYRLPAAAQPTDPDTTGERA